MHWLPSKSANPLVLVGQVIYREHNFEQYIRYYTYLGLLCTLELVELNNDKKIKLRGSPTWNLRAQKFPLWRLSGISTVTNMFIIFGPGTDFHFTWNQSWVLYSKLAADQQQQGDRRVGVWVFHLGGVHVDQSTSDPWFIHHNFCMSVWQYFHPSSHLCSVSPCTRWRARAGCLWLGIEKWAKVALRMPS